ncbi:MAG: serine/threonine-protein kinase [Acidobacteriota bacterium]
MRTELWHRIEPIVDAALDLPPAERSGYLDSACGDDAALRHEVESLIADCDESTRFLDRLSGAVDAARGRLLDDEPSWIGQRFGAYRAVDLLGSGGMGTVLSAERADGLFEQRVAVKVVDRRLGGAGRARFAYERQILADLEHPHIARLLDGGVTDEGLPYLVMEHVEGEPLDTFVERRDLDRPSTLRLLADIARAVDHAHRRRVVHLDLKPSNLLVTAEGTPKLLDFGIAEILDPERHASFSNQASGEAGSSRMTPAYAAPEQLRGETVTSACDVYALGVLLYRLLTGELPFDPTVIDRRDFVRQVSEEPVGPPSQLGSTAVEPDLDAITLRALAKAPEDRYASAAAFADDLDRLLAFEPVSAVPPRAGYLLRRHIRRHRRSWAAGMVATALVGGLGLGWAIEQRRADERIALAQRFGGEAERIEGFLRYAYALPEHDVRREAELTRRRMGRIEAQMATLGPLADGPGHIALGRGWAGLGDAARAVDHLERGWAAGEQGPEVAFALGRALAERYAEERSAALRLRDPVLRAAAVERTAARYRDRALDMLSRADGTREVGSPALLAGLVALVDDRLDDAVEHATAATDVTPWSPDGGRLAGRALVRRGQEAVAAGAWDDAEAEFVRALDTLGEAARLAPSDAGIATTICAAHRARIEMARLRKTSQAPWHATAMEACDRASRIDPDRLEPVLHRSHLHLYRLQDPSIDVATRESHAEQAAEILGEWTAKSDDPAVDQLLGTFHLSRAVLLVRPLGGDPSDDLEQAAAALQRAIEADPGRVDAYANLGTTLAITADETVARGGDAETLYAAAAESFQQALDRIGDHVPLRHNLSTLLFRDAVFRFTRGEDPRALLQRSLDACEATLALNPSLPVALNHRAAVLEELARLAAYTGEPVDAVEAAFTAARGALTTGRDDHPDYLLPWVNTVSLEVSVARWHLARDEDPAPALRRAEAALDHAATLGGDRDPFFHINRAELYLTRAAAASILGGDPAAEVRQARRAIDEGLSRDPENSLLRINLARAAALAIRLDAVAPSAAEGFAALDPIFVVRPNHVPAVRAAAELAFLTGDPVSARRHLDAVPPGAPIDPLLGRRLAALNQASTPDRASTAPAP